MNEIRFWPEDFYLKGRLIVSPEGKDILISVGGVSVKLNEHEALDLGRWIALHLNKPKE